MYLRDFSQFPSSFFIYFYHIDKCYSLFLPVVLFYKKPLLIQTYIDRKRACDSGIAFSQTLFILLKMYINTNADVTCRPPAKKLKS